MYKVKNDCYGGDSLYQPIYAPYNYLNYKHFYYLTDLLSKYKDQLYSIETKVKRFELFGQQAGIGNIPCYYFKKMPKCAMCNYIIPYDIEYYSTEEPLKKEKGITIGRGLETYHSKNAYILCCFCCNDKENMIKCIQESGVDNLSDWIKIFTKKTFFDYYCNLNPKSKYYKKFACNTREDEFFIVKHNSIDKLINKSPYNNDDDDDNEH